MESTSNDKNAMLLPLGFRFAPTDREVLQFLEKRVRGEPIVPVVITDVNVYGHEPWELQSKQLRYGMANSDSKSPAEVVVVFPSIKHSQSLCTDSVGHIHIGRSTKLSLINQFYPPSLHCREWRRATLRRSGVVFLCRSDTEIHNRPKSKPHDPHGLLEGDWEGPADQGGADGRRKVAGYRVPQKLHISQVSCGYTRIGDRKGHNHHDDHKQLEEAHVKTCDAFSELKLVTVTTVTGNFKLNI